MVTTRYAPLWGGVETHVREVATRLSDDGVDLTVLTTNPGGALPAIEHAGALVVKRFAARPSSTDICLSRQLVDEVVHGGYDVVHVQGIGALLPPVVLAAAQRTGLPTVVTLHTAGPWGPMGRAARGARWRALRPMLRKADALVAVCRDDADRLCRVLGVGPDTITVIANGAEPPPVADTAARQLGYPLVVSIGRLERYKGHHRLIDAMPALLARAPGARLVIVGDGRYAASLRRLAARRQVERAVTFTSFGAEERGRLGALVAAADVVTLLSDYEAHPVAIMEALALGRKVVVARTPGLAALARHDLVTAIDPRSGPSAVADVLAAVATAPATPAPALESWTDCARRLGALYEEVLSRAVAAGGEPPPRAGRSGSASTGRSS